MMLQSSGILYIWFKNNKKIYYILSIQKYPSKYMLETVQISIYISNQ